MSVWPWFRSYNNRHLNGKMLLAAKKSGLPLMVIIGFSEYILSFASQNNPRGSLKGLPDVEMISIFTQMEPEDIEKSLSAFEYVGFINKQKVVRWEAAQPSRNDETAVERKQRERAAKKTPKDNAEKTDGNGDVTQVSRNVTQRHADVTHSSKKERERTPNGVLEREEEVKNKEKKHTKKETQPESQGKRQPVAAAGRAQNDRTAQAESLPPDGGMARRERERGAVSVADSAAVLAESGGDREIASAMLAIWQAELPQHPAPKINGDARYPKRLAASWHEQFGGDAEEFRVFCRTVGALPFLCGKVEKGGGGQPFIASIDWAVRPQRVAEIQSGKFGRPRFLAAAASAGAASGGEGEIAAVVTIAPEGWQGMWQDFHAQIQGRVGQCRWKSWFSQLELAGFEGDEMRLVTHNKFVRSKLCEQYTEAITEALGAVGWDGRAVIEYRPSA